MTDDLERELQQIARDVLQRHGPAALVPLAIAALDLEKQERPHDVLALNKLMQSAAALQAEAWAAVEAEED